MKAILSLILILVLSLLFRLLFFPSHDTSRIAGQQIEVQGIIWDEPRRSQFSQRFVIDDLTISVPEYPEYFFGDKLMVKGVIEESTFITKSGEEITQLIVRDPQIEQVPTPKLLQGVIWMLHRVTTIVTQSIPSDEAALLLGITIGVRSEFDQEMVDMFRTTGILHVVAASGSNVVTLTGVVLYSLNRIVRRRLAIGITVIVIAWYAVLAGFDPPIVRASIMALITLIAQFVGRQNYSLFALGITAWLMLMIQPQLLGDVGFQLSITATGGIIVAKPFLDLLLRVPKIIKDDLSTTLAAQLGSIPVMLGAFGSFAPMSVIINLAVLWTVPIIMILGLLASFGALVHPILSIPFIYAAYPFLVYFMWVISCTYPFVTPLNVTEFGPFLTISYYFISLSIILLLKQKTYGKN
ncbi:MAG TPA: ComEC/Rec2 family competence protein [Candidatus Levybacteria bacterium]|nr:ComEC/Rec2 family competence protein [Candidatus Levybacteria bacterium]